MNNQVIRVQRFHYIHLLDSNTNVTRTLVGPAVYTRQEHEVLLFDPKPCISVPQRCYCIIRNPIARKSVSNIEPVIEANNHVKLKMGETEYRFGSVVFPLYPGEELVEEKGKHIFKLPVIPINTAYHVRCIQDFWSENGNKNLISEEVSSLTTAKSKENKNKILVRAGEEWMIAGPQTYFPRVEVEVIETVKAIVIKQNAALQLKATVNFIDRHGNKRSAGEEWLVRDHGSYLRSTEEKIVKLVEGEVLSDNKAIILRAKYNFTDIYNIERLAGEKWLVTSEFAPVHIIDVYEELLEVVDRISLTAEEYCVISNPVFSTNEGEESSPTLAQHERKSGTHDAKEKSEQYHKISTPVNMMNKMQNRYGQKLVRRGPCSFFLHPDERIIDGIQNIIVVGEDEALVLKALVDCTMNGITYKAGKRWMLRGPAEYVPQEDEIEMLERRAAIALDKNEGVYVMNTLTGEVRAVIGEPYMPNETEVLWEKELPTEVEELLMCPGGSRKMNELVRNDMKKFDVDEKNKNSVKERSAIDDKHISSINNKCHKTTTTSTTLPHSTMTNTCISEENNAGQTKREKYRVVRFNVEHNAAVQIYDYLKEKPRIVLGPSLVMLAPHEEFTVLSLSGGKPKAPNAIQSLQLILGPCFSNDSIIVETADHARLELRLSYNWHFDVDRQNPQQKIFSVPDFIGDCCKTIASRVRGAVAAVDFDSFHRNSTRIIRSAVFGTDESEQVRKELRFTTNNFVVTNIDVQSAEPTDEKTRDSLQKSVQLAIEITTKSQEAAARHGNELKDQEAKGVLERKKLLDKIEVENAKTQWLELQAKSEAVQASGQSIAEASAKAEALLIEVQSELTQAKLRAQAYKISAESELKKLQQRQSLELEYFRRQNEMIVEKASNMAAVETDKVRRIVAAVGRETLVAIARAGPEMQAKLLQSLGLKGYLITDGNNPVNLFNTAKGFVNSSKEEWFRSGVVK